MSMHEGDVEMEEGRMLSSLLRSSSFRCALSTQLLGNIVVWSNVAIVETGTIWPFLLPPSFIALTTQFLWDIPIRICLVIVRAFTSWLCTISTEFLEDVANLPTIATSASGLGSSSSPLRIALTTELQMEVFRRFSLFVAGAYTNILMCLMIADVAELLSNIGVLCRSLVVGTSTILFIILLRTSCVGLLCGQAMSFVPFDRTWSITPKGLHRCGCV